MRKVLGKGLDSLLPEGDNADGIKTIKIGRIRPGRFQMRTDFDDDKIRELADTIKERGVFQPLVVTPAGKDYMLIAGERRLRAARLAGLDSIPCIERDLGDEDAMVVSLIENIQRENLSPVNEAAAYTRMADEFSMTQKEISEKVGKSRSTVANTMRILSLPDDLIELVSLNRLSAGHARALLSVKDPAKRKKLAGKIVRDKLTVREAEALALAITGKARRTVKSPRRVPGEVKKMEDQLEKALGTRVRIKLSAGKPGRGSLEVEFYSLKDFERIAKLICGC